MICDNCGEWAHKGAIELDCCQMFLCLRCAENGSCHCDEEKTDDEQK